MRLSHGLATNSLHKHDIIEERRNDNKKYDELSVLVPWCIFSFRVVLCMSTVELRYLAPPSQDLLFAVGLVLLSVWSHQWTSGTFKAWLYRPHFTLGGARG